MTSTNAKRGRFASGSARQKHRRHHGVGVQQVACDLYEAIDTPVSLGCYLRMKYHEERQLAEMEIDARRYLDAGDFYRDYQAISYLKKYEGLKTGINTREVAYKKFLECEKSCFETNARFRNLWAGRVESAGVASILHVMQRKVSKILGPCPTLEQLDFRFGPGANYGVRKETSVYNKIVADLECTHVMIDKLQEFLEEFPGWIPEGIHTVKVVQGSQLDFVPKNAKTDRPICIEPLLNGLMQKGIGSCMRKRLSLFGVDLNDQTLNQRLAQKAYTDQLATVDFSSASDMIAYNLVMDLLPIDWFELLDTCRSPRYEDSGVWRNFHKFSSMGNAYTFELESLIFFVCATSVCEALGIPWSSDNVGVYGDDVILPRAAFALFSEVVSFLGFKINESKTFVDGPFFESCGTDYFQGHTVRPFQQKDRLKTFHRLFYVANTLKRIETRWRDVQPIGPDSLSRLRDLYVRVVRGIPHNVRCVGPEGYGDGHLIGDRDANQHHPDGNGWCGYWFKSFVERPIPVTLEDWPLGYATYHAGISDRASRGYSVRGRTRYSMAKMFCHFQWQTVGPSWTFAN